MLTIGDIAAIDNDFHNGTLSDEKLQEVVASMFVILT
jgi:hypothetical protein